ncbi:dynamin family protein [Pseudonocardia sp.]|jgi:GTP-binding protein EngB required for normal cell division|uniref:dynamin family protein n=1 Tax=Pseudonocardia sp. TaxID=60912 RepID=UPI003D10D0B3
MSESYARPPRPGGGRERLRDEEGSDAMASDDPVEQVAGRPTTAGAAGATRGRASLLGGSLVRSGLPLDAAQGRAMRETRKLLNQHKRTDLLERLEARLAATPGPPVVAVVGEAKRGKSSLVNALLGRREIVPTGADITTAVFVEVRCDDPAATATETDAAALPPPGGANVVFADGTVRTVPSGRVRDWVAVGARPDGGQGPDVVGVRMRSGHGRLPGATIVDTPGAGGLDSGHARLALQACRSAALLVFVTDAGQPLPGPELAFLTEASRSVERVVIAVTKIDKYPSYEQVVDEIRGLLARHAPRFAASPVVPVSAELALQATTSPPALAADLDAFSGVPALVGAITEGLADASGLAVRNALRTADHALGEIADEIGRTIEAVRQTPGAESAADREREELVELRERQGTWSLYLDRDLRHARGRAVETLGREGDRLRVVWRERLEKRRMAYSRAAAEQATSELRGDLSAMAGAAALEFRDAVTAVVEELVGPEQAAMMLPASGARSVVDAVDAGRTAPSGMRKLFDPSLLFISNSAGTTAFHIAAPAGAAAAAAGAMVLPLTLAIAGGVSALVLMTLFRQGQTAQRRLADWASEEVVRVRTATTAALDDLVNDVKPEIIVAYRAVLSARIATLDRVIKEAQAADRADARERGITVSGLQLQLTALRDQQKELATLLG